MQNLFLSFNKGIEIPHIERKFPQSYDVSKIQSKPFHAKNASGVCLVVGTHPCADKDIEAAARIYPGADVCAINDAIDLVPAKYLATAHPEKLDQFLQNVDYPVEIHTRGKMKRPLAREGEYVWTLNTGGGSALFAAAIMTAIGYDLVILCGCPMDGGGGYAVKKHESTIDDPRFGDLSPQHTLVQGWHGHLKRFKEQNKAAEKIRSMSGKTKEIFGGI
jgi:hypothetical protein